MSSRHDAIRQHVLRALSAADCPPGFASRVAERFDISRAAAARHLQRMVDAGDLTSEGRTRARSYGLAVLLDELSSYSLSPELTEHFVWDRAVQPHLIRTGASENIIAAFQYGTTEMVNNAIEHSAGRNLHVQVQVSAAMYAVIVMDDGVGVFRKIMNERGLDHEREAVLELHKGKLTTDPANHTGEGIFFTSRTFSPFILNSFGVAFGHADGTKDLVYQPSGANTEGTAVFLTLPFDSKVSMKSVFDRHAGGDGDLGFFRTELLMRLGADSPGGLVSRSQARRVLVGIERFKSVQLNFRGVKSIGQAFADEVFRVYPGRHPEIEWTVLHTNQAVEHMIARARAGS